MALTLNRLVAFLEAHGRRGAGLHPDAAKRRPSPIRARWCRSPRSPCRCGPNTAGARPVTQAAREGWQPSAPDIIHVAVPDLLGHQALALRREARRSGRRLLPHALRDLSVALRPRRDERLCRRADQRLLSPLPRGLCPLRVDGRGPGCERRRGRSPGLDPRRRRRSFRSGQAVDDVAPRARHRRGRRGRPVRQPPGPREASRDPDRHVRAPRRRRRPHAVR